MAIIRSTVAYEASKSFGNMTLRKTKRGLIASQRITEYKHPFTTKQKKTQTRTGMLGKLSKIFAPQTKVGFTTGVVYHSNYNRFVKINKGAVTVNNELQITIAWSSLLGSKGVLPVVRTIQSVTYANGNAIVTWSNDVPSEFGSNLISVTVINATNKFNNSVATETLRTEGSVAVPIMAEVGDVLHIYVAAYDPINDTSSDSVYQTLTV